MKDQTRHSKWSIPRHRRRRAAIAAGSVAVVAVIGTVIALNWRPGDAPQPASSLAEDTATVAPDCTAAADAPQIATLAELNGLAAAAADAASCTFGESVAAPAEDGWWLGAVPETDAVQVTKPELVAPLASTSLVVVSPATASAPTSWGETVATGKVAVDMRRGTGVHAALRDAIIAELLATGADPAAALTQVAGLAQKLGPTNPELTSSDDLFAALEGGAVEGVIVTEAAWAAYKDAHPESPLTALVPMSGVAPVEIGLWKHGTVPDGPSADAFAGVDAAAYPTGVAQGVEAPANALVVTDDLRLAADAMWTSAMMPMNTLIAMDVSGSMTEPTSAGVTRLELLVQAGKTAASMFPYHSSSLAIWAFSTDRGGEGIDYVPLVTSGPADPDPNAAALTQESLVAGLDELPGLVGGDTGLYDTVLAAVREVRNTYVTGAVNSVVILTDGYNVDENSISLEELLSTLEAEVDPAKPIRVVTIGISADADAASLRQIADATGGSSHVAANPADITDILISAMVDVERG